MKKAQLIEALQQAQERERRLKRSLNQALIDLDYPPIKEINFDHVPKTSSRIHDVLKNAETEFDLNVTEPSAGGNSSRINAYIHSVNGIGWKNWKEYEENNFAWCGAFCAWIFQSVKFSFRFNSFASCYRLYRDFYQTSLKVDEVRTGDIITVFVNDKKSPVYGNHIVTALSRPNESGDFETIEGNAKGYGPGGDWREGVSKRTRNIKDVACIYRMLDSDFDDE